MANETVVRVTADVDGYTSGLDRAKKSAADFVTSQDRVRQYTTNSVDAINRSRDALKQQGDAAVDAFNKSSSQAERWLNQLQKQADQAGKTQAEMMRLRAAQLGVAGDAEQYIAQIEKAGTATDGLAHSSSGARREMLVLAHEASQGNWTKFGGSMMVLGERMDLLKLLMNPVTLGLAAMAAAGFGLYEAMEQASAEAQKFNDSMKLTNDWSGLTRETAAALAETISGDLGTSFDTARKAVEATAESGLVLGTDMQSVTEIALLMAKQTGESFDKALESVLRQQDGVSHATDEWEKSHHDMDAATLAHIKALDNAGDHTAALRELYSQELKTMRSATETDVGAMRSIWNSFMDQWAGFKRALAGTSTLHDQRASLVSQMNSADYNPGGANTDAYQKEIAAIDAQVAAMNKNRAAADAVSAAKASLNELDQQTTEQLKKGESQEEKRTAAIKAANDAYRERISLAKQAGTYTPALDAQYGSQRDELISDAQRMHKDPKGHQARTNENGVNADLASLTSQQKQIEDALRTSLDHIKALRAEGVVSEQDALTQSYIAEQDALQKRIAIDEQQETLAEGKKNTEAYRRYADDIARLQQQMTDNYAKFGDDIAKMSKKESDAVKVYTDSLSDQLKTQQAAADTRLAGLSMGGDTKAQYDAQIKLMEDYDKKVAALSKSLTENRIGKDQYDAELKATKDYYDASVAMAAKSADDIRAANESWAVGATRAVESYADSAANVASQVESSVTSAAKGMEDALTTFVTSGKLNFKSLVDSIIADIVRMQARAAVSGLFNMVAGMLGGMAGGGFGTLGTTSTAASAASGVMGSGYSAGLMGPTSMMTAISGARANGGPVAGGDTYLVGEKGPELFTPGSSGSIVPNHALGSSGGGVSVQIVNNSDSQVQQPQVSQDSGGQKFIRLIIDQAKNEMAGEVAGGQGAVSKALSQRYGLTPRFR